MTRKTHLVGALLCLVSTGAIMTGCGGDPNPTDAGPEDGSMTDANTPDFGVGEACATAGATRPCGTDVGACAPGTQTCGSDLTFGDCVGAVSPRTETCNGLDDDCDGTDDNVSGAGAACGTDQGECSMGTAQCVGSDLVCVGGTVAVDETCNGLDDDCDGTADNGVLTNFWRDADNDTYGDSTMMMSACAAPVGYVTNDSDCNDACTGCFPGGTEVCDGNDNNCNGTADEGVLNTFFRDADMDTFGDPSMTMMACTAPTGYVANSNDCNDACNTCFTGRAESCDALDNNCNGTSDEGFGCIQGSAQPCATMCGTTGTGFCSAVCTLPAPGPATCTPPEEICNNIDEDCDMVVDEGVIARTGQTSGGNGNDGKLANITAGYVGVRRRGGVAEAYRVNTAGVVRGPSFGTYVTIESANVVSVDIDRLSDTQWSMASTISGTGVQVRLLGLDLSSGDPTITHSRLVADTSATGVSRVAINSASQGRVIYQAGSTVRTAWVQSSGGTTATSGLTLPGTGHKAESGMDIAATGIGSEFVITWVAGITPQVHVALISGTSNTVTSDTILGAGTNPSVEVDAGGNIGVVYTGGDNLPRFHHLTPTLTCLMGGGAANTCARTLGTRTVNPPAGAFVSHRTLDIAADGGTFWIAARVSDGEQVFRVSRSTTHDNIHRPVAANTTLWMSVGAQSGLPLVLGGNAAYTHNTYGCP